MSKAAKKLGVCLVTGAAGFFGRNLVRELLDKGVKVRALYRSTELDLEHKNLELMQGDVAVEEDAARACDGVNTVFHAASVMAFLGGSAVTEAYRERAWRSNVGGTENLIKACLAHNVGQLIYTSSVDVCFDRKRPGVFQEDAPYGEHPNSVYQLTKTAAEKRVLRAAGSTLSNGAAFKTCALRPDGIYGAESNYMIDAFVDQLKAGTLKARIGNGNILGDNSHVKNLCHAHWLAALNLADDGVASGRAYFISDDEPMNSFEFFRPLIEGLGHKVPGLVIPGGLIRPLLVLLEQLHFRFGLSEPFLSPHELDKITVTHFGTNKAAHRDFGYEPIISVREAMVEILEYCQSS